MTNQSKCDSDKLLTRKEVSEFFKVDISTVHNWTKKGKLKAYGIANRVYYKESELKRALTEI
ncbi:helix-turn-helix domain-containing protein [Flagellimonas oceanensis]